MYNKFKALVCLKHGIFCYYACRDELNREPLKREQIEFTFKISNLMALCLEHHIIKPI